MKSGAQIQPAPAASNGAVRKHICIDFEGEGRTADGSSPHPSLLGALVPNANGKGKHYRLWLFEPELAPMTRSPRITGRPEHRKVCSLEDAIAELVELAKGLGCKLVAFTEHELNMVKAHLPETSRARIEFEQLYCNIQPKARKLANRRKLAFKDRSLNGLLDVLSPKFPFPERPDSDVAEACRRLRKEGARSKRWSNWADEHQQRATTLIEYNRGDCKAVWRLVNIICADLRNH